MAIAAAIAAYGCVRAVQLAWLCDDSFISIRYATHLAEGLGLVYNAGERVEGYTNLLWTLMLALAARFGMSPVYTAQYLGIVWYAALAWVLLARCWRRSAAAGRPFVPIAAAVVLISEDFHVWASGGLETSLFALLAVSGLTLTREPNPTPARSAFAGSLLGLGVLTRPDALIFAVAGVLSFFWPRARSARSARCAVALAAPLVALLAIGVPAKLLYYGELFPTAFYAKSVLDPYVSQGLVYLALFLWKNGLLVAAATACVLIAPRAKSSNADAGFYLATAAVFCAYLVEVGGDFMYARRLIPIVPFVLIALEDRIASIPTLRTRSIVSAGLLAAAALPLPLYGDAPGDHFGVYDERRSYPPEILALRERQAHATAVALHGLPVRVAFEGGMCVFGYYSRLPYLVETTGLTQYSLARRPLSKRGAIGHEKSADADWFERAGIHLLIKQDRPPLAGDPLATRAVDEIRFGDIVRGQILVYSDEIMDPLRARSDVSFVPIEDVIARAESQIERLDAAQAEQIYAQLDRYYFRTAGPRGRRDAARLREIVERKRSRGALQSR